MYKPFASVQPPISHQLSAAQRLLLAAALHQGEPALAAWRAWRLTADLDQLPPGGFELLPLMAHNLQSAGINDPLLDKCQGILRRTWTQNQLALRQAIPLLQQLQSAGIKPIVHAGTAAALFVYPQLGTRMVHALNLLTPITAAPRLAATFAQTGWHPQPMPYRWLRAQLLGPHYPQRFQRTTDATVRLAWQQLPANSRAVIEPVDAAKLPPTLHGLNVATLSATDRLFEACGPGIIAFHHSGAIQWIADAVLLLQPGQPTIDWARFVARAQAESSALRLTAALHCLQATLPVALPPAVLTELEALPVQPFERWELTPSASWPRAARQFLSDWATYRRRGK